MIGLALAITDPKVKRHIESVLNVAMLKIAEKASTQVAPPVDLGCEHSHILRWLERHFLEDSSGAVILLSDLLKQAADPIGGALTRICQATFGKHALGTIAIMQLPERITDIDRTVSCDATSDDVTHALVLVIGRLKYIAPPQHGWSVNPRGITIRPLKGDNETEFRDYFRLRHRVYTEMGYLDQLTENCRSKLEMNEADVHSIHLGAFYREGARETLVGSARVVTNRGANWALQRMFESIAGDDPVARQRLSEAYPLGLPIFQTHRDMTSIMIQIFMANQNCGELSRVIVDRHFRGNGISRGLVSEALDRAASQGIRRIFLECLGIHEKLYEEHGFRRIPGMEGTVPDINRTMIAMELQPEFIKDTVSLLTDTQGAVSTRPISSVDSITTRGE
jgi:GNAT superfamily N-acetyltransferase